MNKLISIIIGLVLVAALVMVIISGMQVQNGINENINSFEECVEAGYAVMESYPEQCSTPDGRTFTRDPETELSPSQINHINSKSNLIVVDNPEPLEEISSPVSIQGEARGQWYFEASFPVRLEDSEGNVLAQHFATAEGEWMTEEFVPFSSEIEFNIPADGSGVLVFEKANPSGFEENADELRIPVRFSHADDSGRVVSLYYYSEEQDQDDEGNVMCSAEGLVEVQRNIPLSDTPIQDTISLLIGGGLTTEDKSQGISTEYPLEDFDLVGAALSDGVLTLEFSDPNNATNGGSCRASILWLQIEETAKQFEVVDEVEFKPEELFQP